MRRLAKSGPSSTRARAQLAVKIEQNLKTYALAASAAGVAVLACNAPAEAAPVCKTVDALMVFTATFGLSPANQLVPALNLAQSYHTFSTHTSTGINRGFFTRNVPGAQPVVTSNGLVAALASGANIGPGGQFGDGVSYGLIFTFIPDYGATTNHHRGNVEFGKTNFLGFKFLISGQAHYGWVSLVSTIVKRNSRTPHVNTEIVAYGYESTPNTAIAAGSCGTSSHATRVEGSHGAAETASIGALALGAQGIPAWRQK